MYEMDIESGVGKLIRYMAAQYDPLTNQFKSYSR